MTCLSTKHLTGTNGTGWWVPVRCTPGWLVFNGIDPSPNFQLNESIAQLNPYATLSWLPSKSSAKCLRFWTWRTQPAKAWCPLQRPPPLSRSLALKCLFVIHCTSLFRCPHSRFLSFSFSRASCLSSLALSVRNGPKDKTRQPIMETPLKFSHPKTRFSPEDPKDLPLFSKTLLSVQFPFQLTHTHLFSPFTFLKKALNQQPCPEFAHPFYNTLS